MNEEDYILIESRKTGVLHAYPVETNEERESAACVLRVQGYHWPVIFPIYRPGPDGAPPETGPDPYSMVRTGEFITLTPG